MAAKRKTPDNTNAAIPYSGTQYQIDVNTDVKALWRYASHPLVSVAGTNTITAASDTAVVDAITGGYLAGMKFTFTAAGANTGAVTINIDSQGAGNLLDPSGTALTSGAIVSGRRYAIERQTSDFRIISGWFPPVSLLASPDFIAEDQKTSGTAGGASTSGAFNTRTLNTAVRNVIGGASLAANEITLPAGTYYFKWSAPAKDSGLHQTRMFNVTDASVAGLGSTEECPSTTGTSRSMGSCTVTIAANKNFRLEHRVSASEATDGLGRPATFGNSEIYSRVEINKIA